MDRLGMAVSLVVDPAAARAVVRVGESRVAATAEVATAVVVREGAMAGRREVAVREAGVRVARLGAPSEEQGAVAMAVAVMALDSEAAAGGVPAMGAAGEVQAPAEAVREAASSPGPAR